MASEVNINSVVWITSLNDKQYSVTRRILDDLTIYLKSQDIYFLELNPQSGDELIGMFDMITNFAADGLRPIIHIDTHGSTDGLYIEASKEEVPWPLILEKMQEINVATQNNLAVISLACFGFYLMKSLKITEAAPFYIMAGSEEKLYDDYIERITNDFYKYAFDNDDIVGAYRKYLINKLRILHSENLVFESLARYIRAGTMGEAARQRVEDLITYANMTLPPGYTLNLKKAREIVKNGIKPTKATLDRLVNGFMIGRPVAYDIDKVIAHAKTLPDPYADGKRKRPSVLDQLEN